MAVCSEPPPREARTKRDMGNPGPDELLEQFNRGLVYNGRVRIKAVGLSMTGNVSADGQSMRGEWNASDVACKGTFEISKKW